VNKGIGAGGKNTNKTGKNFEELTNNGSYLLQNGWTESKKNNYVYISLGKIIYLEQINFTPLKI
jgi:hypothetical protein